MFKGFSQYFTKIFPNSQFMLKSYFLILSEYPKIVIIES